MRSPRMALASPRMGADELMQPVRAKGASATAKTLSIPAKVWTRLLHSFSGIGAPSWAQRLLWWTVGELSLLARRLILYHRPRDGGGGGACHASLRARDDRLFR